MKKIFFSFLIFMFFIDVHAGQVFVSKRDSDTGDFLVDCDFLLYDQYENIVDSWIQGSSSHILNLPRGSYLHIRIYTICFWWIYSFCCN